MLYLKQLSGKWPGLQREKEQIVSKEAALDVLKKNVSRFDEPDMKTSFRKWEKIVQYNFTDIGELWCIEINKGDARLIEGSITEKPELEYIMTTETCVQLSSGNLNGMQAHKQGLVKVQGAIRDMLKWKKVTNVKLEGE